MNPVEAAVIPLKNEAIARAEQEALKIVATVQQQLSDAGNDLNVCAPLPKSNVSRATYQKQYSKYLLFNSLTHHHQSVLRLREPKLAEIQVSKVLAFVDSAKKDAAIQYDAFVAKLSNKIGTVQSAALTGNHVWGYSILSVVKADSTKENWKTQTIINVSKLGKLFNQWPTRKVK